MVVWAEQSGIKFYAKWFCSCGACWGESRVQYASAEEAMDAGEAALPHLYDSCLLYTSRCV